MTSPTPSTATDVISPTGLQATPYQRSAQYGGSAGGAF
jgi:hypothetical protein